MKKGECEMINRARTYIKNVRWQNAKTYEKTAPHEYTVRKWRPDLDEEFKWFASFIQEAGVVREFWNCKYKYLHLDGYRYWTMGDYLLINRCPVDQVWQ